MKELNEDIKRLRQIMSYNRGKGLLVVESQYDMKEQEEVKQEPFNEVESIAKQIYAASKGMGTDESQFIDAVKDIENDKVFMSVDELLKSYDYGDETQGFEYYVNDEFGNEDADSVESIVRHLNKIGIESTFEKNQSGRQFVSGSFKLTDTTSTIGKSDKIVMSDCENIEEILNTPNVKKWSDKILGSEQWTVKSGYHKLSNQSKYEGILDMIRIIQCVVGASVDGKFGNETLTKVKEYQEKQKIKSDGIVGDITWCRMFPHLCSVHAKSDGPYGQYQKHSELMNGSGTDIRLKNGCPTMQEVISGKIVISQDSMKGIKCDLVTTIQKALLNTLGNRVGLSIGDSDFGIYGPKTVSLVTAFQSSKGLKIDGKVGSKTMKALLGKTQYTFDV